jgi:hypothetical protein
VRVCAWVAWGIQSSGVSSSIGFNLSLYLESRATPGISASFIWITNKRLSLNCFDISNKICLRIYRLYYPSATDNTLLITSNINSRKYVLKMSNEPRLWFLLTAVLKRFVRDDTHSVRTVRTDVILQTDTCNNFYSSVCLFCSSSSVW